MCNNENTDCKCINEILSVICLLQKNASCCGDVCLDTCDRGFLGCSGTSISCNTRPVMLYTCCGNGTPWAMPISKCVTDTTSPVFRIEKLDGCCATFRVLEPNTAEPTPEIPNPVPFLATNSFFTMNLNCVCSLRCLADTYVECI